MQGDVHEGHAGGDSDHGAIAEAQLADSLGDDIDQDLGAGDLGQGSIDKFASHNDLGKLGIMSESGQIARVNTERSSAW